MKILIDGDILCYQAASPSAIWRSGNIYFKGKPVEGDAVRVLSDPAKQTIQNQLKSMVKEIVDNIEERFTVTGVEIYLKGDGSNYRTAFCNEVKYKENRGEKPRLLEYARQVLSKISQTTYADDQEADDLLGIRQCELGQNSIIVSKDKDLLTIPGFNYNPYHRRIFNIPEEDADRNFYSQILTGDRADNIPGIYGIGPVKAAKLLKDARTPKSMLKIVLQAYEASGLGKYEALNSVDERGKLLRIRRSPGEVWSARGVLICDGE